MGKNKKTVIEKEYQPKNLKTSVFKENPDKIYDELPVWSFKLLDTEHERWGITPETLPLYITYMKTIATTEWKQIFTSTSGKNHGTRSHSIPVEDISSEAQKRLMALRLDDITGLYSVRVQSTERIWGIFQGKIFYILWFDDNHEVCPSSKR